MSYLLDALRKSNSRAQQPGIESHNIVTEQMSSDEADPHKNTRFYQPVSLVILAMVFTFCGYVVGGGADVMLNYYQPATPILTPTAAKNTASLQNENNFVEPLKPYYGEINATAQYFSQPEMYNQQLINNKQNTADNEKAILLAEQKQQEKQQQLELSEQIQLAMAEQGLMIESAQAQYTANNNNAKESASVKLSLNKEQLGNVSPELLQAFETAIDDTNVDVFAEAENDEAKDVEQGLTKYGLVSDSGVKSLALMPMWLQNEVPVLHFSLHMYSSDLANSWVRLNGQDYYTGGITPAGLIIEQVQPQKVIMQFKGQRFSLPALSSW